MRRVYLDYNATVPVHLLVAKEMGLYLKQHFGNPSSTHYWGVKAREAVEKARRRVAGFLGSRPKEIVFTSGGTESNNYAIGGVAEAYKEKGNHIITSSIEHPSVANPCAYLRKNGFEVTCVGVDKYGMVNPDDVKKAIKKNTILVTIMHANNETGVVQPIEKISRLTKSRGILLHTDAAQSLGKIPANVARLGADLLTVAGHKIYASKGVGALYVRRGVKIHPLILGANHEGGRMAGTENVAGIAGLGKACELLNKGMVVSSERIRKLRDKLYHGLIGSGINIKLNGHPVKRLPNTLNVSFDGIESSALLKKIPEIAVSTGSACHAGSKTPSAVLTAMGVKAAEAFCAVRISMGLFTMESDMEYALGRIIGAVKVLARRR